MAEIVIEMGTTYFFYIFDMSIFNIAIIILLYNLSRERDRSRGRSREYKEKDKRHSQLNTTREERKGHRDHSRSREREQRIWSRESHHKYVICEMSQCFDN